MIDPTTRRKLLSMQLVAARERFVTVALHLGDHAHLIALLEGELSATEGMIGCHRAGPCVRELAATVALGALQPLQPHVSFVSAEAVQAARDALLAGDEEAALDGQAAAGRDRDGPPSAGAYDPRVINADGRSLREAADSARAAAQQAWDAVTRARAELDGVGVDPGRAEECRLRLSEAEADYGAAAAASQAADGAYTRFLSEHA